jgi:hypothetical protein
MSTSVCYEKTDQDCPDDEFHDIIRSQCVADGTGINVPQGMSNGHCYSKESLKTWLSTKPQNEDFFGGKFNDADKQMIYDGEIPGSYQEHPIVEDALNNLFEAYENFPTDFHDPELTWQQSRDVLTDRKLRDILYLKNTPGDGALFIHRIISWNQRPGGKYLAKKLFDYQLEGHFIFSLYIMETLLKAEEAELAETYYTRKARTIITKEDYKNVFRYFEDVYLTSHGPISGMRLDLQNQLSRTLFYQHGYEKFCDMLNDEV